MNRSLRVGLTGGLAGGKSTVAGWLRDAGFLVIDADKLVSDLYLPGEEGAAAVRDLFGPEYLNAQGGVDHAKVAEKVFADP
jgi:dephospho-CoA kinase